MSTHARPPLRPDVLTAALVRPGSRWRRVRVVESTASTNADVAVAVAAGEGEGLVVVAEHQHSGKGRLDRVWVTPPRSALTFSVSLSPGVQPQRLSWLPLLAGVAVTGALADLVPGRIGLKWPNDVLVGGRKLAGILAERVGDTLVLGIGLNVSQGGDDLPTPAATSLALAGARTLDRDAVLVAILRRLDDEYGSWVRAEGDAVVSGLAERYRACCATLRRRVHVSLPDGTTLVGEAVDVSATGALVVTAGGARHELAAGDVVHVRDA